MHTLRTDEAQKKYEEYLAALSRDRCVLCEKEALPGMQFSHWKVVINDFPYDQIADRHDMIMPRRHVTEDDLNSEEQKELLTLKDTVLNDTYDYLLEAVHRGKSIPGHFHIHLITAKV